MNQTNGLRYATVLLCLTCSVVMAPFRASAASPVMPPERKTPREMATEIARHSKQALQGIMPAASQQGQKRDGVFLLVSFSMPEETLKEYLREAKLLGAQVVLRGIVNESFKETQGRIKRLFFIDDTHPDESTMVGIGIDPVLYRRAQVTEVPALLIVQGDHLLVTTGASSVAHMLKVLADRESGLTPWILWFERRHGGFHQGGPTQAPRPPMPPLTSTARASTGYDGWGIAERDMIELLQERVAKVDWKQARNEQNARMKTKLAQGPGLALPSATEPRRLSVDLTVEYPEDITDPTTKTLLVKAGSRVNPLTQLQWKYTMLVLNGNLPAQVAWAQEYLARHDRAGTKVLLTEGNVERIEKQLKHRVYWADRFLLDRFGVVAVPSLVRQEGGHLAVEEYVVQ